MQKMEETSVKKSIPALSAENRNLLKQHHADHAKKSQDYPLIAFTAAERPDIDNTTSATYRIFADVMPLVYDWTSYTASLTTVNQRGVIDKVLVSAAENKEVLAEHHAYLQQRAVKGEILALGTHGALTAERLGLKIVALSYPSTWHMKEQKQKAWEALSRIHKLKDLTFFESEEAFYEALRPARAAVDPETGISASARRAQETMGPEGLAAKARKGKETLGPEGRSAVCKKRAETLGPEGRTQARLKALETMGPEGRSAAASKRIQTIGVEKLSQIAHKGNVTRGPQACSDACVKRAKTMGAERLSQTAKKRNATLGPEGMLRSVEKARETKKRKWEAAYVEKHGVPATSEETAKIEACFAEREARTARLNAYRAKLREAAASSSSSSSSACQTVEPSTSSAASSSTDIC